MWLMDIAKLYEFEIEDPDMLQDMLMSVKILDFS